MARHHLVISILLSISWLLAWVIYTPGLQGPFLFDDFPNLKKIGALGPIDNWELFRAYIDSGFSGPTGRPISLTSFLLDANDWPAEPFAFKYTNILIHILIGVILFPTSRNLLTAIGRAPHEANWIALLTATLWLLNPFLVSTTLYIVQRMTQLAALFVVIGIWGYLHGRTLLSTRPYLGYTIISSSAFFATLLAVLSKENGALLPFLILSIECALRFHWSKPGPDWRWKAVFLGLPSAIIIIYLAKHLPGIYRDIPTRDFSLAERLLTEPRILWDYLFHLVVPHIQTRGLYQDGLVISTNLVSPWSTLPALLGILTLGICGWLIRRRWPLLSLAILFFLTGHLIESTTITLELYFEHRNYLPAIFLFLPIASGIYSLQKLKSTFLAFIVAFGLCASYALATWQRADIWGSANQLQLVWAEMNPNSPRAQNSAAQTWANLGFPDRALALLDQAMQRLPDSSLLTGSYLSYKASLGKLSAIELATRAQQLRGQSFDAQMLQSLKHLVETLNAHAPLPEHTAIMMSLLAGLRDDLQGRVAVAHRYTYYLQGLLQAGQGDGNKAYSYFHEALSLYDSVETGLNIASVLATYGHFQEALKILKQSKHILSSQKDSELKRNRKTYEQEITKLHTEIQNDIKRKSH